MENIVTRVATIQTGAESVNLPGASKDESGGVKMEVEKTIKDIINERQEQLKDLEQLQDMKSSNFVDALTNDIEGNVFTTGPSTILETITHATHKGTTPNDGEGVKSEAVKENAAKQTSVASAIDEMQERVRADLAKLVEEKEAEIQGMVTVLDTLKAEISKSDI